VPSSLVVINPHASKARDASTLAALTERLGAVLTERDGAAPVFAETPSAEEVGPLVAKALDDGVASIVGVGGDGTMRDIAAVIAETPVPLGIVPAGTGNQVAAVLGIPRVPIEAVDALEQAQVRTLDLGQVSVELEATTPAEVTFILGCGAGFDAELMATTPSGLKRRLGAAAYFAQGTRLALRLSAMPCRVTVDGELIETAATAVLIGNLGQLVPGRLDLRLPLDPADGLLDLIVVGASNPFAGARGLLDQLRRTELGGGSGDRSLRRRGRVIRIEPERPLALEVDGDYVGYGALEARIRPGALRVLAPPA
jgi:diacylglycerol kinase (ATP)